MLKKRAKKLILSLLAIVLTMVGSMAAAEAMLVRAAAPAAPSYEFLFTPMTGSAGDATGDGGGGADPYRLQEYYVGQTFGLVIRLHAGASKVNGGDARFDIEDGYLNCVLDPTVHALSGNLSLRTFNDPVTTPGLASGSTRYWVVNAAPDNVEYVTGDVNFARLNCTVLQMREPMPQTNNPLPIKWYFTGIGDRLDSNIAEFGTANEILNAVEDANIYLWPDTNKPYADGFNPLNGATGVSVTSQPTFWFRDKNSLISSGVTGDETGVNTAPFRADYKRTIDPTMITKIPNWANCSGTWNSGRNQCQGTMVPNLIGSSRYFSYNTNYTVCLRDGQDIASNNQPPAAPGPNVMDQTCFNFTTEPDTSKPDVINAAPANNSTAAVTTNISFQIRDVKSSSTTVHGTGVDPSTVEVNISGFKQGNTAINITVKCGDPGVTCTGVGTPLEDGHYYAYNVVIDPSNFGGGQSFNEFAQNSEITVTVRGGQDYAGNVMNDYTWKFKTQDVTPPSIENIMPATNSAFCAASVSGEITFEIVDTGVGTRQEDTVVRIMDDFYQIGGDNASRITFSGDANHWYVTINPLIDLKTITAPFAITINTKDQANNVYVPEELYALVEDCGDDDGNGGGGTCSCGLDNYCDPDCELDPDCPGNGGGGGSCAADNYCNLWCENDPDCSGGAGSCACAQDNYCNPLCAYDPDCPGNGGIGSGTGQCGVDGYCNPFCPYDPDCQGNCGRDNYCNAYCAYDPDCSGGSGRCGQDNYCNPYCAYDPDCQGSSATGRCGQDNYCNPLCLYDPDCPGESGQCGRDNYCNPYCLNDPDCSGGTNCKPTGGGNTNCPISNCQGKNYESCNSCCAAVTCPTVAEPEVIYRYRTVNVCEIGWENEPGESFVLTGEDAVLIEDGDDTYDFALGIDADDETTCQKRQCYDWWYWWPWILVIILTFVALHQAYKKRQYRLIAEDYEKRLAEIRKGLKNAKK